MGQVHADDGGHGQRHPAGGGLRQRPGQQDGDQDDEKLDHLVHAHVAGELSFDRGHGKQEGRNELKAPAPGHGHGRQHEAEEQHGGAEQDDAEHAVGRDIAVRERPYNGYGGRVQF